MCARARAPLRGGTMWDRGPVDTTFCFLGREDWPLGSHLLLGLLILLQVSISALSRSLLSLPGPSISWFRARGPRLPISSLPLEGDYGFPAFHISASDECSPIAITCETPGLSSTPILPTAWWPTTPHLFGAEVPSPCPLSKSPNVIKSTF